MVLETAYLIAEFASTFSQVYGLTSALSGFYYGKHVENVAKGFEALEQFFENGNRISIDKALSMFHNVSDEDRDFVKGGAAYGMALCYAMKCDFSSAYSCLDKLDAIEIGWSTVKKDTLRGFQKASPQLRKTIKELERDLRRDSIGDEHNSLGFGKIFKWLIITAIVTLLILMVLAYFGVVHIEWLNPFLEIIPGYKYDDIDSITPSFQDSIAE